MPFWQRWLSLEARCEIPTPPIAQYPVEIVSQRGVSHAFCLVFTGYRASITEIPLLRGGGGGGSRTSTSHALQGGNAQKRGTGSRGNAPNWPYWDTKNPIVHNRGYRWDSLAVSRNTGPLREFLPTLWHVNHNSKMLISHEPCCPPQLHTRKTIPENYLRDADVI